MKVKDIGPGDWSFVVEEYDKEDAETFKALSIADIMTRYQAVTFARVAGARKSACLDLRELLSP